MNRIIIVILFLFTVNFSYSQSLWDISKADKPLTIGLQVGHNASTMRGEQESSYTRSGWHAGISVDYSFVKSLAIVSGLYYTTKGFGSRDIKYQNTYLSYLQVPLQASYRIRTKTGVIFHFNGGMYFAYGLSGHANTYKQSLTEFYRFDQDAFGNEGFFKHLDVGLAIGAKILLGHVSLGLIYEYGLVNIAKVYGKFYNQNVALSIGYNF